MPAPEPRHTRLVLQPDMPAHRAVRQMLLVCIGDAERHLQDLQDSDDPEGPHGVRVALRRMRSVLWGFRPILRDAPRKEMAAAARALFRGIGALRDADVMAGDARAAAQAGDPVAQAHAAGLTEAAARQRALLRADLEAMAAAATLQRARDLLEGPVDGWCKRGRRARARRKGPVTGPAHDALQQAWHRAGSHGRKVARMPTEERHAFRKDLKRLRYLCDFCADLWPGKAQKRFLKKLKALQDDLGTLNDLDTAAAKLGAEAVVAHRERRDAALRAAGRDWKALRKAGPWW